MDVYQPDKPENSVSKKKKRLLYKLVALLVLAQFCMESFICRLRE